MHGRDLLGVAELSAADLQRILDLASGMKRGHPAPSLEGKSISLLFDKPSLRTRVSFEVGMRQLGGHAVALGPQEVGLGERESVADVARVLSRYVDGIVYRTYSHLALEELAGHATVPVINALSDREHPCQALADLLTIWEKKGRLEGLTVAFVGDGNNVAASLALACSLAGASFRIASPPDYGLSEDVVDLTHRNGLSLESMEEPREAVTGADVVYTDVWVSMGQEAERAKRLEAFQGYQVTPELLAHAQPDCLFMHDLPAHSGEEIAAGMLGHPSSVVFDQAENRLHTQKAILALLLADEGDEGLGKT